MSASIPTAVTPAEARALIDLARGKRVLEVGSLLGYSTVLMAEVARHVVAVDPHEGYPAGDPRPTLAPFLDNLSTHNVRRKVTVLVGTDADLPFLAPRSFDLAFIDTTGEYEDTWRIMHAVVPLLRPDGVLAVHDCGHPDWPGAEAAARDFSNTYALPFALVDRLAIFTPLPVVYPL